MTEGKSIFQLRSSNLILLTASTPRPGNELRTRASPDSTEGAVSADPCVTSKRVVTSIVAHDTHRGSNHMHSFLLSSVPSAIFLLFCLPNEGVGEDVKQEALLRHLRHRGAIVVAR